MTCLQYTTVYIVFMLRGTQACSILWRAMLGQALALEYEVRIEKIHPRRHVILQRIVGDLQSWGRLESATVATDHATIW